MCITNDTHLSFEKSIHMLLVFNSYFQHTNSVHLSHCHSTQNVLAGVHRTHGNLSAKQTIECCHRLQLTLQHVALLERTLTVCNGQVQNSTPNNATVGIWSFRECSYEILSATKGHIHVASMGTLTICHYLEPWQSISTTNRQVYTH